MTHQLTIRIFALVIFCTTFYSELFAQDIIILKNTEEIKSKVEEIGDENVKYKKFDHLDGPSYNLKKKDIFMIKYENGTKEVFESTEAEDEVKLKEETKPEEPLGNPNANLPYHKGVIKIGYTPVNFYAIGQTYSGDLAYARSNHIAASAYIVSNRRFSTSTSLNFFSAGTENLVLNDNGVDVNSNFTNDIRGYSILGEFFVHYGLRDNTTFYSGIGGGVVSVTSNTDIPNDPEEKYVNGAYQVTIFGFDYHFSRYLGMYGEIGTGARGNATLGLQIQF